MTDKEALIEMFKRAGIVYDDDPDGGISVVKGKGPKNLGYGGFIAAFDFKEDGSLDTVGAWE